MKKRTTQVAELPIRIADDGEINVLLVSSRETRRWVIPKGWPSKKMSDAEAREEAGVTGKVYRKPVGFYRYRKVLPASSRILDVAVYVLWVRKQRKSWAEQKERTRIWATLEDAAKLVREPGLKRLFAELEDETRSALRALQQEASVI
jgi:8-oxo-dGTP pyrophosphatase MutT (NUDIX family)